MNYLIWRTPQYNSSHWNRGALYEFLDYLATFLRLFTMMDEEGNYLNNVLQYFQWGCAKGSTRWQDEWNQTGQHRHLRQRERCLGSVQWKYHLWETQANYSTPEPGLATLTDLISCNWWEQLKPVLIVLNFTFSFCHSFADFLLVFAQAVVVEQCRLVLGKVRQVSHAHSVDCVIQKWFGHS